MTTFRLFLAIAATGLGTLHAQPIGGQVAAGTGSINAAGSLTQINQTSSRLIIDWTAFSIAPGSTVNFTQPGAMAAVLNRVTGHDASALLGTLSANGQVYLLNPNGVLIGSTGRITTAGFIASTTRLSNADFLRGSNLAFGGGSDAAIVNQGQVSSAAGPIVFIARRVENSGSLSAPGGVIQLVGGTEVLLATPDSPALILAGSQAGDVSNAGAIAAAQVRLQAVGNNAAALAINQTGVIRATGVEQRGGEVWLVGSGAGRVTQQGEISARNADGTGGTIRATGDQLLIAAGSKTDASGPAGGGGVELGGAERGATLSSSAANARETLVESGAVITADALAAGDGGRVILWGTDALGYFGSISARGATGGPGGFIETSGGWLDLSGHVEAGLGGSWLIDPFNIRIVDGPSLGFAFSGANPVVGRPTSSESRLDVRVLEQALESQGKVVIDTGGAGNDVGNIIIDTPLFYRGRQYARLSMNAANDIYVNQPITSSDGSLDLDFNADFDANGQGKIILGSDLITRGGTVTFQENVVTTGSAGLSILSGGGDIIFAGDLRLENLDGLDLSSQGGDILMASLSSGTQRNAILRLTDLGPRNVYTNIAALLASPVQTPEATIGDEAGRLVKRRSLRRVNNPPGYQTVAWMGFKQDAGQGSLVSPDNFGPTQPTRPIDDSYMDFPKPSTLTSGNPSRPPIDDSYMDVAVPNTPFWAQDNPPPTGGVKPPIDDSYMDFPWVPQSGGGSQLTNYPNSNRPPIDDSYMDAPFLNQPGVNPAKPVVVTVAPDSAIKDTTVNQANPPQTQGSPVLVITQAQPPPAHNPPAVVATQPQLIEVPSIPVTVTPTQPVGQPPAQQPAGVVVTAQPPLPVVTGPQNNPGALQGPNTPTVVATNPTALAVPTLPMVVNNPPAVAQPPPQQPKPIVAQSEPPLPISTGPQNNPGALQGPKKLTVVAMNPTALAVPTLPVVVNNPPVVAQPPAQQVPPTVVQAVPALPINSGPQNNTPALQGPNTPTVIATNPTALAVPTLPVTVTPNQPVIAPPTQQPTPVVVQSVPQVPVVDRQPGNPGALQGPTVVTTTPQPQPIAVPTLPVVVNNPPVIAQPPAQQPAAVVITAQPPLPVVTGPQNNPGALQAPNTPTVVATNPTVVAVPTLPLVVTNPPTNVPQPPPAQQAPVVVQAVPQVPVVSGPQNNAPALQAPNTPTVVASNPTVVAVPTLPVVVNNPPDVPQPPPQPTKPVVMIPVPQVPVTDGPQNNPGALQAPNTPTVVATNPTVMAVPSLPMVVTNPPANVPQPPPAQQAPVVVQAVPQVPVVSGPQNNAPALQAPNTPTVVASNRMVMAVPSLPVVVNNPPADVPQPPPAQQPPVVAQIQPPLPVVSGPQNNAPALQAPNTPTIVATQPIVMAVPSLPVVVNNPPAIPQPPAQKPGPVVMTPVPQVPVTNGPQNNAPALHAPNTPTVIATQPTVMAVPSLPVVVNNPPAIPQPPAQQPGPVVMTPVPQVPVTSGPQNNPGALQGPNTPTVVANQPTAVAVPTLPVVVNNPPVIATPPAQQPAAVVVTAQPPLPVVNGPQNNPGALQAPNTPTVVATQPTLIAVPSLPLVVNNPPAIPQPPAQQPVPVVVANVPQVPISSGPQNNPGALQAPNTPTVVATQPTVIAVPSLPVVVNNPPAIPQPPAQQPGSVVMTPVPQVPVTSGPQNNAPALQAPNTPSVVATQPAVMAVPSLPVVVNNPPVIATPPAQQPTAVVVTAQPPLPVVNGPQNNPGALQAPNTPTVVATQPTALAVPTLPVVVNNPPVIPQPPAQQPGPVIVQAVPQIPTASGPQNNLQALQAPITPTVVATNPTVVAVPSLPAVVNNPPVNVPRPPPAQQQPVVAQLQPPLPVVSGPQVNAPALQAPNTPNVVATNPIVMAVPTLPVVVTNPPVKPQPPAQQPGPVIVQAVPPLPTISGPQNNPGALQGSNTPMVIATNPTALAVPTLPVVVNNPPVVVQPPAHQMPPTVVQAVPALPISSGPQNNPGAIQGPNTPTVIVTQTTPTQTTPTQTTGPTSVDQIPPGQVDGGLVQTTPNQGGQTPTDQVGPQGPQQQPGHVTTHVAAGERQLVAVTMPRPARESEIFGLRYNIIYRNYEAQSLVNDIGRPLYALASGYEFFLYLEGRPGQPVNAPVIKPAPTGQ